MKRSRILPLAAVVVLLGLLVTAVAVITVAALPTALALGLAVLALIAGVGTRLRRWSGRRAQAPTVLADVSHHEPVAESGESPLRWTVRWDSPALLLFPWVGSGSLRRVRGRSSQVKGACGVAAARALRAPLDLRA